MRALSLLFRFALLTFTVAASAIAEETLLTREELLRIDRENEFWRTLRAEDDTEGALVRLRRHGASAEELSWFEPKLARLWSVDVPRAWGWLRPEQIDAIKEVDRAFIPRVRAARLRVATGIEIAPAHRGETLLAVNARWQRALLRVLEYDQIAEFRLMNSASAQKTGRHFENVPLTDDERRTIYEWQREFEATSGPGGSRLRGRERVVLTDHRRRIRELIGDDRFAVYLASAEPRFARMHDALGEEVENTTALDAWAIREQFSIERDAPRDFAVSSSTLAARTAARLQQRLGEPLFARYAATADAKWLTSFRLRVGGGSTRKNDPKN